jgi:hypothetical protein
LRKLFLQLVVQIVLFAEEHHSTLGDYLELATACEGVRQASIDHRGGLSRWTRDG